MKYLFDTTTYSHLLKDHEVVADTLKNVETILLSNVVFTELKYGFSNDSLYHKFYCTYTY